jgi:hypothetical protein
MDRFALTKWYVDAVDARGRAAILYSTALCWGSARVGWHGLSVCEPDGGVSHRTSVGPMPLPSRAGGRLAWRADSLGCAVNCAPTVPSFAERLLDRTDGVVEWRCEAPAATVDVSLADAAPLSGAGYAERVTLTCPPWRLPIEELRWGRWVSDDGSRSLVWIDWRGPVPRTDVFLDGKPQASPAVAEGEVRAGEVRLAPASRRPLYSRSVGSALAGLGPLLSMLPASWLDVEDAKWIGRARLDGPDGVIDEGWYIDERVRFPR